MRVIQIMDYDLSRHRLKKETAQHNDQNPSWLVQVLDNILNAHGSMPLITFKDVIAHPEPDWDIRRRQSSQAGKKGGQSSAEFPHWEVSARRRPFSMGGLGESTPARHQNRSERPTLGVAEGGQSDSISTTLPTATECSLVHRSRCQAVDEPVGEWHHLDINHSPIKRANLSR